MKPMKPQYLTNALVPMLALLLLSLISCSRTEASKDRGSTAQNEQAQDQKTREEVAGATQKVKEKSKELGQQAEAVAQKAKEKAKVVAQGVKEGWDRDRHPIDLNSATESELRDLPGLVEDDARRIIGGRPYKSPRELVTKGILTEEQYRGVKDLIAAK